jgi:hypothetical protein
VSDTHQRNDPADKTGGTSARGDGGHASADAHPPSAPTPTEQNGAESAGRAVHSSFETQKDDDRTAPDTGAAGDGGGGHTRTDTHPPRAPSATDRAALLANRQRQARSVLKRDSIMPGAKDNTYKPVGDCTKFDLENMVRRGSAWAQFARRVLAEAEFADDQQQPLKDVMDDRHAERIWNEAWKAVTHGS